jgi:hypothetical protein
MVKLTTCPGVKLEGIGVENDAVASSVKLDGVHKPLDGIEAEQLPSHWIVPEFVMPQELADEVQELLTLGTQLGPQRLSDGVETEQLPSHWIVPEFVMPQELADEVQELPWLGEQLPPEVTLTVTLSLTGPPPGPLQVKV